MIIKALPNQIPALWPAIKYSIVQESGLKGEALSSYIVVLLQKLLSSKAHCFVRLSDKRELLAILTCQVIGNVYTGERNLCLENFHSYRTDTDNEWGKVGLELLVGLAKKLNCAGIAAHSANKRVNDILTLNGFEEQYKYFVRRQS